MEDSDTNSSQGGYATRVAGQAIYYLAGNGYSFVLGFLFQIYLASTLGAAGLGVLALLDAGTSMISALLSFGIGYSFVRFIPAHLARSEAREVRVIVWRGLLVVAVSSALGYVAAVLARPVGQLLLPEAFDSLEIVRVFAVLIPVTMLSSVLAEGLRGFGDVRSIVIGSSFLAPTLRVGLGVWMLSMSLGLIGYVWALVLSSAAGLIWMAMGLLRHLRALRRADDELPAGLNRRWFGYASVMYGQSLWGVVTAPADRFVLGRYSDAAAVGVASVAKLLSGVPGMLLQVLLVVLGPMFSEYHARGAAGDSQRLYHLSTDWSIRFAAPLIVFLAWFAGPVLQVFGDQFATIGRDALLILLVGQAVNLACGPVGRVLNMSGRERVMLLLGGVHSALYLVLLFVLTPALGIVGIALALAVATVFINFSALWVARRGGLRWWEHRYWRWLAALGNAIVAAWLLRLYWPWDSGFGLVGPGLLTYLAFHATYIAGGLHPDDREVWGGAPQPNSGRRRLRNSARTLA